METARAPESSTVAHPLPSRKPRLLFAAQIHAREANPGKQAYAVGTELNASHISAGREGIITATATAVHLGRSSTVHTVEIRDEADRLISIARVTNRILVRSSHD